MKDAKDHILNTSLQLFMQKSFKEVTMKEIVDKTGLSKGAFYHYFNSKEQVFAEVIQHFLADIVNTDYSQLSETSLKAFYNGLLQTFEKKRTAAVQLIPEQTDDTFNNNFYYLIFDAMRMMPNFKANHLQSQKEELEAWQTIVGIAKKNKEIKTSLTDEQVAKLFIYLSDGTNINLIMSDNVNTLKNELKSLWDSLYNSLKAQD